MLKRGPEEVNQRKVDSSKPEQNTSNMAEGGRVDATNKHGEEHFADLEKQGIANTCKYQSKLNHKNSIARRENIRSISGA